MTIISLEKKYLNLIDSELVKEEDLHKFFVQFPIFLPLLRPYGNIVFSKFPLANNYVVDFAFAREDSPGVQWTFIEIEKPQYRQATKKGDPTKYMGHSLRQISDNDRWFNDNRSFIKENFPFKDKVLRIGMANAAFKLVIGRRAGAIDKSFLNSNQYVNYEIMSFDRLLGNITGPAIDQLKPLKVCRFSNSGITTISEFNYKKLLPVYRNLKSFALDLSPCVVAKAKVALGLPNRYVGNSKHFTKEYWEYVLRNIAAAHGNIPESNIRKTIGKYEYYLKLR
ncbi:MAG: DUF4263 domain-containing protein [Candidatus Pseudobacter hemicellulosilyticus]|uniref:DUF4263 domain-containing protein n=1 Tax=Candidatus Pseudobacter hemicellulosilyticus TaxID=3121375 RepID=A0AAJ5WR28_9BACT|nr:MAG: DUF4263 domain-containing protein [Pseudobacter sp.]